jgi:hypothetical protein
MRTIIRELQLMIKVRRFGILSRHPRKGFFKLQSPAPCASATSQRGFGLYFEAALHHYQRQTLLAMRPQNKQLCGQPRVFGVGEKIRLIFSNRQAP